MKNTVHALCFVPRNFNNRTFVFLFLLLFYAGIPAFAQKKEWKITKQTNTIEAYREFANRFSASKFAVQARDSLCSLGFRKSRQANTIEDYTEFSSECGGSSVQPFLCELYFEKAKSANTAHEYRFYLNQCPKAKNVADASDALLNIQFAEAKKIGTLSAIQAFISECKECRFANNAKQMLDSLQWIDVVKEDRLFSYYSYIVNTEINATQGYHKELASNILLERLKNHEVSGFYVDERVNAAISPLTIDKIKTPGEVTRPNYENSSRYIPGRGVVRQHQYNGTTTVRMTDGFSSHTETSSGKSISINRNISASKVTSAVATIDMEKKGPLPQSVIFKYFDNSSKQGAFAKMDLRIHAGSDIELFLKIQDRWYAFSKYQ